MLQHTSQQAHGKLDEQLAQRVSKKGHTSLALSHWGEPQGSTLQPVLSSMFFKWSKLRNQIHIKLVWQLY